jgi:2,4-diketo-3-deoxy-L-fuconate hydrolase
MNAIHEPPFALGTFSVAGCAPFAGLVIDSGVIAIDALRELLSAHGVVLTKGASVLSLLEQWPTVFPALDRVSQLIRSGGVPHVVPVASNALRTHVPVASRQVFCTGANYRQHVIDIATCG